MFDIVTWCIEDPAVVSVFDIVTGCIEDVNKDLKIPKRQSFDLPRTLIYVLGFTM